MKDKNLTPKESLEVISQMIETSKIRINENGFIYLFWGWLMMFCAISQFVLFQLEYYEVSYYPYFLAIPGGIYTAIYYARQKQKEEGSNYLEKIFSALWISVGSSIFIVAFVFSFAMKTNPVPYILLFLGIGTVVSGQAIRFKPIIIGGIICMVLGISTIVVPYEFHPVVIALALIFADLIPGYTLRNKYKKQNA